MLPNVNIGIPRGKMEWRAALLAGRRDLAVSARRACAESLVDVLRTAGDGTAAAYVSFGAEPPTGPLLYAWRGRSVLLPVLLPDGDLDWARYDGRWQLGPGGLVEPAGPRLGVDAIADCAVVVVPALAVDAAGVRLGRGGGSYDRALARATGLVVAALYDHELVPALPSEPHDRRVDAVVLPGPGLVHLPRGRDAGGMDGAGPALDAAPGRDAH